MPRWTRRSMRRSMRLALARCVAHGVRAGAHPSFPDRAGFGRALPERFDAAMLCTQLVRQVQDLRALAEELGTPLFERTGVDLEPEVLLYGQEWRDVL